ncbi:hypothetical protein HMP0721_0954 [Pseudoramibacter alactolyticus ATCC 23263]|uniref:Uncharacterized protein n=1 Tax=Pseudoramibacter alactolyticus ATCC 23263 TaxID=887929 RepID=E6MG21_9FIRM|nr:hypothetical protein HMP0721_0954 [Pseudoramibacter alactolyticus ATCC 23263]
MLSEKRDISAVIISRLTLCRFLIYSSILSLFREFKTQNRFDYKAYKSLL